MVWKSNIHIIFFDFGILLLLFRFPWPRSDVYDVIFSLGWVLILVSAMFKVTQVGWTPADKDTNREQ